MTPILFIHGFPFDGSMWDGQAAAGFPMLAPDLPGFGPHPEPPPEAPSIEAYAASIHGLLVAQHIRPIVAGLSMGGYILLALLRSHPEDVAGAVFIDTRADADSPEARANRFSAIQDVRRNGTAGLLQSMLPRLLAKDAPSAVRQRTLAIMQRQSPATVIAAQTAMAGRLDQTDLLPQIAVPTLVIVGDQDIITPPALMRSMQARIPGARLAEIPGAGHLSPLESPAAVNALLGEFAESVPAPAPSASPR